MNELGALPDAEWPVMRQAFHEGVAGVANAAVVANSDMGETDGRTTQNGFPSGKMHSGRKVNLGRRNGLAMLKLLGRPIGSFQPGGAASGPVLESATITKMGKSDAGVAAAESDAESTESESFAVRIVFQKASATNMHFAGSACCIDCCGAQNASAVQLRVANASDPTGFTWQRAGLPVVEAGSAVTAVFKPTYETDADAEVGVDTDRVRFMYEGEPECVLYNGVGGPDDATAIAASPFYVTISGGGGGGGGGAPVPVPAPPCAAMLQNGSCYFAPEPCSGFHGNVSGAANSCTGEVLDHCCWDPITNKGQCEPKGSAGCNRTHSVSGVGRVPGLE